MTCVNLNEERVGVAEAAVSGQSVAIVVAVVGLLGTVIGIALSGIVQAYLWVRSSRLTAYADLMDHLIGIHLALAARPIQFNEVQKAVVLSAGPIAKVELVAPPGVAQAATDLHGAGMALMHSLRTDRKDQIENGTDSLLVQEVRDWRECEDRYKALARRSISFKVHLPGR